MNSYLPLHDRSYKAREVALEWVDERLYVLESDKAKAVVAEQPRLQALADSRIEDLEEIGRRLSIFPTECRRYHGKWNSQTKTCGRKK